MLNVDAMNLKREIMAKKKPSKLESLYRQHAGRKKGNNLKEPLWDLDRDGISFSMLSKYLICPERFRLAAVEGWTPKGIAVPLEFGSAFHKCMEHVEGGGRIEQVGLITNEYMKGRKKEKASIMTTQDMQDLERVMGMVQTTFYAYHEYWSNVHTFESDRKKYFDHHFKYKYQEETFDVIHTIPSGRKVRLRGRWDAVLTNPVTKKLCLQENKTKSTIDEYAIEHGLKKDLQTQFYLWTLYLVEGLFPRHVLYNVIRRAGLRPGHNESVKDFVKRVEADIEKRPDHYFMRWVVDFDIEDLTLFRKRALDPLLTTVVEWWDSIKHRPFDPWTLVDGTPNMRHYERPFGIYDSAQYGGGKGDFFEILYHQRFDAFYQRDIAFPELEDEE